MSNQSRFRFYAEKLVETVFPQQCFCCGASSGSGVVCVDCLADLPGRSVARCPVCALPQPEGAVCGACVSDPPPFDATLAVFDYAFPVDKLVHALKYGHRLAVSRLMVEQMADLPPPQADLLVPLPLHPARLRERGFNQAAELARALGRHWRMPVALDAIERDLNTQPQAGLPWRARAANIRGAFRVKAAVQGLRVAVVDDVMTTGATLAELARSLKAVGALRVENRILARTPPPG